MESEKCVQSVIIITLCFKITYSIRHAIPNTCFRPFPSVQPYTCNANAIDAPYLASFIFRYIQLEILILGASKAFVPSSATYMKTGKLRATQKRKFGSKPP